MAKLHGVSAGVEIRPYEKSDLETIVEFSLRAWQPVFASLRRVLGDPIFERLNQLDWTAVQAEAVRSSCTSDERDVFVAVADGLPVGFAAVAINAFHERMGVVDIIAVDPAYQRRGIARALMERSAEYMRARHGHRSRRDWRRPGTRAGARSVRGARLHGAARRQVPPAARLTRWRPALDEGHLA
jgi:GNAT superfamily N-acetyltransferase